MMAAVRMMAPVVLPLLHTCRHHRGRKLREHHRGLCDTDGSSACPCSACVICQKADDAEDMCQGIGVPSTRRMCCKGCGTKDDARLMAVVPRMMQG